MEEITFLGVSDDTREQAEKSWESFKNCNEMYEMINRFCEKHFKMTFAEFGAFQVKTLRDFGESLKKVEEESVLPSEREAISNYRKTILPLTNFTEDLGDGLLNMVTDEGAKEIRDDKGIKTIIDACLFT